MNEELMNFVKWLPEHVELFEGLTTEETVSKINDLSASEEGKETLKQLTKQYKNTEMGIFKEGGKLNYLICLKKGGSIKDCGCSNKIEKNGGGNKIGIKDTVHTMQLPNGNTYELSGYSPNVADNWRNSKERILDPNGNVLGERNIAYGDTLNVSNVGGNPERLNPGFDRLKEQTLRKYYDPARVDMWKRNQTLQEGGTVKRRRTDKDGYAWTLNNGVQVLTQDASGEQTIADSYYEMPGSPELETRRAAITDKGGNILGWDYTVYNNNTASLFPIYKYTTKKRWYKPMYKELDEAAAKRFDTAFKSNFKTGGVLFAQSGAAGFYRNWSEDDIRALKNKLAGYAGYEGDLTNGKVDSEMIEAVKRYQRDHKLKDDGMWGHNTNSIQKMLDPSIMDKGSYKKSYKTEQGDLYTYNTLKKPSSDKGIYTQISELQARAISNPEWFWGDSQDAQDARAFFYQNWKKPEEAAAMKSIIDNIYSETPREIKNKIDAKKLPQHIQQARMNAGITDATGKVADFVATKALPAMALPLSAAAAPLATVGGLAGGALGSVVGGNTWRNLHEGDNANYEVTDELGNTAVVVRDPDQYYYNQGALVGGVLGGVFGSMAPGAIKYGTEHLYSGRTRPSRVSDHKGPHGYRGGDGKFIHADNEGWFDGGNIFDFSRGLLFKKGGKL